MKIFKLDELEIRGLKHIDFNSNEYYRLPLDIIDKVNDNVTDLAKETTGARIRFKTNSKNLYVNYISEPSEGSLLMSGIANTFISVYIDGKYNGIEGRFCVKEDHNEYNSSNFLDGEMHDVTIYLPIHSVLKSLYVGIDDESELIKADPYKYEKQVVFYGSSITQGLASGHAGGTYVDKLCRRVNTDYLNLGFSGSARGEESIANYIASLDMSCFVFDYDHNAPSITQLKNTHERFYKIVRVKHPDLPIIMISKPDFKYYRLEDSQRREVIRNNYLAALERKENVYFVDGETFFIGDSRFECTSDGVHPNDLGMEKMALVLTPILIKALRRED